MKAEELRSVQRPLKERYREAPDAALITLRAQGRLGEGVSCKIETGKALVEAGLHPATGGSGQSACSGDMLLEALAERRRHLARHRVARCFAPGGRRSRFSWNAWRGKGSARGLPEHSAASHPRHRCLGRAARHSPAFDGAVLRCLPDAGTSPSAVGGSQTRNGLSVIPHTQQAVAAVHRKPVDSYAARSNTG